MGLKIWNIHFQRPLYVVETGPLVKHKIFAEGLLNCLESDDPGKIAIFRACQLFNQCHYNEDNVTNNYRIILLTIAFEVLFGRTLNKDAMAEIGRNIYQSDSKTVYYYTDRGQKKKIEYSTSEYWGLSYYLLRSAIVHGDRVTDNLYKHGDSNHFEIGRQVFADFVSNKINPPIEIQVCDKTIPEPVRHKSWKHFFELSSINQTGDADT
jgi:hypothetical protein